MIVPLALAVSTALHASWIASAILGMFAGFVFLRTAADMGTATAVARRVLRALKRRIEARLEVTEVTVTAPTVAVPDKSAASAARAGQWSA